MEYLVISNNKLKIMLDSDDVGIYGLLSDKTDYRDPKIRKVFWKILDKASLDCGFKVNGEKLLVQYYPSGDGGEIFVTKLGRISPGTERSISGSEGVAMLSSKNMIYRFENAESLKRACTELERHNVDSLADLYCIDGEEYYLFFEDRCDTGGCFPCYIVCEFADEIPQNMESYIKEHSGAIALGKSFYEICQINLQ